MAKAQLHGIDRRVNKRYRVPGSARVFWDGDGAAVTLSDMSAGGCLVAGERLPAVGTRVFLSLELGGLPNVRLPAVAVRRETDTVAALRFEVPGSSIEGLDKLLAQFVNAEPTDLVVLVIDSDERSRMRIMTAVRGVGASVVAVDGALAALRGSRGQHANVVLARADVEGLAALSCLSRERPAAFRVAYGRKPALEHALALGIAQAAADDPCSAKVLGELFRKGRMLTSH